MSDMSGITSIGNFSGINVYVDPYMTDNNQVLVGRKSGGSSNNISTKNLMNKLRKAASIIHNKQLKGADYMIISEELAKRLFTDIKEERDKKLSRIF
jgi:hypothetical protein